MDWKDERKGYLLWELANAKKNGYESFVFDTLTGMKGGDRKLALYHDIRLQEQHKELCCLRRDSEELRIEIGKARKARNLLSWLTLAAFILCAAALAIAICSSV